MKEFTMRFSFAVICALVAILIPAGHSVGQPAASASSSNKPITLEFGNMKSEKPALISMVKDLKSQSTNSNTSDYAGRYVRMIRTLKTVGIGNLSQAENDEILSIPEPTDAAMATFIGGKKAVAEKLDENIDSIHKWIADERAKKLAAEQLAEEQRQTALKEKHEQDRIDAMNCQAAAQERAARSMERQTQLQNVARRYYY